jgi:hypothetical protein
MAAESVDAAGITNLVPAEFTPDREDWLTSGLIRSLPSLRMAALFALRRDMFRDADLITAAVGHDGSAIGALSSRWTGGLSGDESFLHILTQFVGEDYQGSPVFRDCWGAHLAALARSERGVPGLFVLKTYNPIVFCAMRAFTFIPGVWMYPDIRLKTQQSAAAQLAAEVAAIVSPGCAFSPETAVIAGAGIPADLYPDLPPSADLAVNEYFAAATRPGDRVLCLFGAPTMATRRAILGAFGITLPGE